MSILKSIAKWAAIVIAFLILMVMLQDVAGYVRVGIGLGIFIGVMFHGVNKRLEAIEKHLLRLRARAED